MVPKAAPSAEMQAQLRYYNPRVHKAAFVLPQFAQTAIDGARLAAGKPPARANFF